MLQKTPIRPRWSIGRWIVGAGLALILAGATALGAAGDLDTGFDGDGRRVIDLGGPDVANALAIQPDGKIVLAVSGSIAANFFLIRLLPDGSSDASFGDQGVVEIGFDAAAVARAVAIQADGRIVVAGNAGTEKALARVLPDGSPDLSFSGDGRATTDPGQGNAVAVRPDGGIVLAGQGVDKAFQVVLVNSSGQGSGTIAPDFDGAIGPAQAVALQPDGRIVAAGSVGGNLAAARLLPNGMLDESFSGDGKVRSFSIGETHALALQADGGMVLAGETVGVGGEARAFALTRLRTDGSFDTTFAGDGVLNVRFGEDDARASAVTLQPDGKIVAAGIFRGDMALARVQPGGSPDNTFSADGRASVDFGGFDGARGVAAASDGGLVLAGSASAATNVNVAVARLQGDPPPPGAAGTPGSPGPGAGAGAGAGAPGGTGSPPRCGGKRATIIGTARSDVLRGTRGRDVIVGLAGNDTISGLGGKDVICGGAGKDRLKGGAGADLLLGGAGPDILAGGAGLDVLRGGAGKDRQLQ